MSEEFGISLSCIQINRIFPPFFDVLRCGRQGGVYKQRLKSEKLEKLVEVSMKPK